MFFTKKKLIKRVLGGPDKNLDLSDIFDKYLNSMLEYNPINQNFYLQNINEQAQVFKERALIERNYPFERNKFIKSIFGEDEVYRVFTNHSNNSDFLSLVVSYYIQEQTMNIIRNPNQDSLRLTSNFINLPESLNSMSEHEIIDSIVEPFLLKSSDFKDVLRFLNYQIIEQ